jgi:hypothetical protein
LFKLLGGLFFLGFNFFLYFIELRLLGLFLVVVLRRAWGLGPCHHRLVARDLDLFGWRLGRLGASVELLDVGMLGHLRVEVDIAVFYFLNDLRNLSRLSFHLLLASFIVSLGFIKVSLRLTRFFRNLFDLRTLHKSFLFQLSDLGFDLFSWVSSGFNVELTVI